ncbi:hypothetical protein DO021_07355 [Desulfobacter hydrogenophilus]|uniref:Cobalamin-independent methionine synthase MetE N-terminal domain-containing protein n=1 Tax=Desulfobacter hydrogenophilus TaxID=2291 RepID=A0A328FD71_9BACT|nr:hypothetical protein EYB58_03070 [Desulfobacter hydrogenophilus]RAM02644.1 hypothetical protein DO021_07355 [Desulfobacter hydrogenophilus]
MTKWFDTNYHYIVPEFDPSTGFCLDAQSLLDQLQEAQKVGVRPKQVIIGPVTYLFWGKAENVDKINLLNKMVLSLMPFSVSASGVSNIFLTSWGVITLASTRSELTGMRRTPWATLILTICLSIK